MERSLDSIVEEIAQSDEMSKEFAAMDEMDEIYRYCKDAGLEWSEDEFDDAVSSLVNDFDYYDSKIPEYELNNVAGGRSRQEPITKGALILYALLNRK